MSVPNEGGKEEDVVVKPEEIDAFGNDNKAPVPPKVEGAGKEKVEVKNEDVEALKKQIEDVKKEYGGNLSGQREVIKRLEAEIETLRAGGKKGEEGKEGKKEDEDVLYNEIKWSKDLTDEERDEMTATEIKQMDEIATMKEAQNKLFAQQKNKDKQEEVKKVDDLNTTVRTTASELSKGEDGKENLELANQIIETVKMFNLTGLSEAEVIERVKMAAQHTPNYKPPKEQINKPGSAVKTGTSKLGSDPFGIDKIIEEATSEKDGNYAL